MTDINSCEGTRNIDELLCSLIKHKENVINTIKNGNCSCLEYYIIRYQVFLFK